MCDDRDVLRSVVILVVTLALGHELKHCSNTIGFKSIGGVYSAATVAETPA